MESHFGYDFSQVRIHTDTKAVKSARTVNALAYTVGRDIVLGEGSQSLGMSQNVQLLAHELTHVVQQGASNKLRRETNTSRPSNNQLNSYHRFVKPTITQHPTSLFLRRKLIVNPTDTVPSSTKQPKFLTKIIQKLLADTCPDGNFQVDPVSGIVTPSTKWFCEWRIPLKADKIMADIASKPVGCRCLCDVCNSVQTTTIAYGAGGPGTSPGSTTDKGPGQGGMAADPTVQVDPRFKGQYRIDGKWVDVPFHLLLAHEICGHALPKMQGRHAKRGIAPKDGTPPQEKYAVDIERQLAAEQNPPVPSRPEDYYSSAREKPKAK